MSKLDVLKEWFSIADAARELTTIFGNQITEADVLRLGLDGHLTLSVLFVNQVPARLGKVVPAEQARTEMYHLEGKRGLGVPIPCFEVLDELFWLNFERDLPEGALKEAHKRMHLRYKIADVQLSADRYVRLEDEVDLLTGIWDLPLVGAEVLDVQHYFQQLTDGPDIASIPSTSTYVNRGPDQLAELQERFTISEHEIAPVVRVKGNASGLHKLPMKDENGYFYPASGLPEDTPLVVRAESINEFRIKMVGSKGPQSSKESNRKINNLYRVIALMMKDAYRGHINKPGKLAESLAARADEMEVDISDQTISNHIKAAINFVDDETNNLKPKP